MAKIILPKDNLEVKDLPLFFLGGPIRGAPPWQDQAIDYLLRKSSEIVIASPRRILRRDLEKYRTRSENQFQRQRAWEWNYLKKAGKENEQGSIIFWLPGEVDHRCEKAYGAMTRIELGQWMTRYHLDNSIRLSIGTDGRFSEWETILYDLREEHGLKLPVFDTLEKTCLNALELSGV